MKSGREREKQRGIPGYRCRHTGARGCNALLMNTKNFIKDCLYIKLSTKLCPITPVAPSRLETIGCRSGVAFSKFRVPLMTRQTGKSHNRGDKNKRTRCPSWTSVVLVARFISLTDLRLARSADDTRDIRRPSKSVISRPLGHTLLGGTI